MGRESVTPNVWGLSDLVDHDVLKIIQNKKIFLTSKEIILVIRTYLRSTQIGGFHSRIAQHAVIFTYVVEV